MRYLALFVCLFLLSACGQKGGLYLPAKNPPSTPTAPISQP
ncbi:lipoprotein [Moraxellaceae bacterium AER2_44_116]|nr:lipoprotein [Moraxellaceae bacterium]TQC99711.1 lipoprotein [Moraxellaceae bacterium AER2_44_116]